MISAVIGAFALVVQAGALPDTPAAAPVPTGAPTTVSPATVTAKARSKDDPDAVVCKNEAQIGSNIPSRVCRTRGTWDAMREEAQRATMNIQNRALTVPTAEMNRSAQ